ncbi:MAG: SDR family NAD(P)-dependent oxidoreductase [Actinomycetota bacterium]
MDLCLVTGGAGFIGSHTVDHLLSKGYRVRVLDNLQPRVHPLGKPKWLSNDAEFIHGDVADPDALSKALEGAEFVLHLAAYQDYMPDFSHFINTNAGSSALIFELAVSDRLRFPVKKFVFASSQSVCGEGRYLCALCAGVASVPTIPEQLADPSLAYGFPAEAVHVPGPRSMEQLKRADWDHRCPNCNSSMSPLLIDEGTKSPGTAYAISKFTIELLAERLGKRYGIPTGCMRYTYVQGPRNSPHNPYSGVARRFALCLLDGIAPTIYEDGKQLRDYVNVSDVARANVMVMEDERANFGVFNVGGGRAVDVLTIAEVLRKELNSDLEPAVTGDFRVGDTRHTVSDISAMRTLGWEPTVPLEQSLHEYAEWIVQQHGIQGKMGDAEKIMREQGVVQRAEVR